MMMTMMVMMMVMMAMMMVVTKVGRGGFLLENLNPVFYLEIYTCCYIYIPLNLAVIFHLHIRL